jgi:AraC family transcriptional regulator of adaptative response/methylated-DNA-[protein]-cysteine methyltransferase
MQLETARYSEQQFHPGMAISNSIVQDPRWQRLTRREPASDFYYSVRSTGVYCRPSCPSRLPNPANVAFYDTTGAAEAAGFRPCKRCRPLEESKALRDVRLVEDACRRIEAADPAPSLTELAADAQLSPWHFQRLFKSVTGLSPKAWSLEHRAGRLRRQLQTSQTSVTDAIYDAGFNSGGRAYATSARTLGMTPSAFRKGEGARIRYATGPCSMGTVLVAESERGVCSILLGDSPEALADDLRARFPKADLAEADPAFAQRLASVIALVEAPGYTHELPLDLQGTAFQQRVWRALREIPPGQTATYSQIAAQLGQPKAFRAVARACAANPVAVAVPCHRVLRAGGDLSGYRWGRDRKQLLLEREAATYPNRT